ncbi:MAG: helix-turn-helix domain-containing protein [Peptococcaceae bacterium]|jgi:hypothetical protein|nr:helix-turn-helix domain-containing protein [Peptococcaceae bacterium]
MLLSGDCVAFALRRKYTLTARFLREQRMDLRPPLLCADGALVPRQVYIWDSRPWPGVMPADCLILGSGSLPGDAFPPCDCVWLTQPMTPACLLNETQEIFAFYQNWDDALQRLLWADEDAAQQMLDISVPVLENRLNLVDADFHFLGFAQDPAWPQNSGNEMYYLTETIIEPPLLAEIYDSFLRNRQSRAVEYVILENMGVSSISVNLFNGAIYMGNLGAVPSYRDFESHDSLVLTHLARYLEKELIRGKRAVSLARLGQIQDAFAHLLQGHNPNEESLSRLLRNSGFQTNDRYHCLVLQLPPKAGEELAGYIGQRLLRAKTGAAVQAEDGLLAMIINVSVTERQNLDWEADILSILTDLDLICGVSRPFTQFSDCFRHYKEAVLALRLMELDGGKGCCYFADCALRLALRHCVGSLDAEQYYGDGFRQLIAHDAHSQVSYVETLGTYLEEGMNALRTATRLDIRRNSFLARLDRIQRLLREDLNDPHTRFYLELCVRLYREEGMPGSGGGG